MRQEKKNHKCPDCGKPTSKYQLKKYGCCHECQLPASHGIVSPAAVELVRQKAIEKGGEQL
jgi:ribosomal protein L37AE/L43A